VKKIGIGLLVVFASIVSLMTCGSLFLWTAKDLDVTAGDRALLLTADSLEPYFEDYQAIVGAATVSKKKYLDHSIALEYEYDSPEEDQPYLTVTITHDRKSSDADLTFSLAWKAMALGMGLQDVDVVADEVPLALGDRSRTGTLVSDGGTIGNLLVIDLDNCTYEILLAGFTIDDSDVWLELLAEPLEHLAEWEG